MLVLTKQFFILQYDQEVSYRAFGYYDMLCG
jgi:hypothetical protein